MSIRDYIKHPVLHKGTLFKYLESYGIVLNYLENDPYKCGYDTYEVYWIYDPDDWENDGVVSRGFILERDDKDLEILA